MPPRLLSLRPHAIAIGARPRVALSLPVQRCFSQSAPRAGKGKSKKLAKGKKKKQQGIAKAKAAAEAKAAATATAVATAEKPSQNLPWGLYRGDKPLLVFPSWRKLVALGVTVFLGYLAAKQVRGLASPDTAESDEEQRARLGETAQRLDDLPVVKALREEEGWVEVQVEVKIGDAEEQPKQSAADETRPTGLVAQRLAASTHLLGPRRVWWNQQRREGTSVGWAGPGVTGWPTVVHGGAIAAVVVEAVGLGWQQERKNWRRTDKEPSDSAPSDANESMLPPLPHQPLQLDLTYLAPTRADEFYVVRFRPAPPAVPAQRGAETDLSPRKDMTKREAHAHADADAQPLAPPPPTEEWTATLEKAHGGNVCVKARVVMPHHETEGPVWVSDKSEGKIWRRKLWVN